MTEPVSKEELRAAAEAYFGQGCQIVPFKLTWNETKQEWEKKPLIEWKPLEETRQTQTEFEALPWAEANAFGIVTGFKMANGLYPCAIDFDVKKLPTEIVERGRPLLNKFRTTKHEGTISKGQHLVYAARDKPKNDKSFHGVCGLEVIGDKTCLLMYPSYGYTAMNDNGITEIENINTMLSGVLSEAGIQARETDVATPKKHVKRAKDEIRPCIKTALEKSHIEHLMRLAIAAEYKGAGYDDSAIAELFKNQNDFNLEKTLYQVKTANPSKAASCETIRQMGYCLGPEKCGFDNTRAIAWEVAGEVGDTFTYMGDQPFRGRIQVAALGFPQSRYLQLTFHCAKAKEDCPTCDLASNVTLNFESPDMDPSAFATYFDTNMGRDALRILVERGIKLGCPAWWNCVVCMGEDERAVTQAVVMDQTGTEGRAWFVHGAKCDLKRAPNWVISEGWLCKGKMGKIGVLVYAFTPESEVAAPKPEDVEKAKLKLCSLVNSDDEVLEESVLWKIAEALQRQSQLKGNEIVKGYVSDLLTIASPIWVKTPEGPPQLGATTNELGPTTTAKSLRIRMLREWLESGKYDTGRKTPAGLTAGAEKTEGIGWIVRKGLLPSMDLSWLVIDNMWPHALDNQIESRRDGVVTITAIRNAELWARCRLKLLSNPSQPFDEVLYKCTALKVYDSKFIARFAFALFTYGVSTEERYSKKITQPQPGDAELLEAAKTVLKWNLSKEITFTVPEVLWSIIMEYGKTLEETFGCEDIPLLLRSNPYKLACLAYSFALLEGTNDPTDRHVRLAYKWLDFCARDIELDKYMDWWRSQHLLGDKEYDGAKTQIESEIVADVKEHGGGREEAYLSKIIEYLAKNEKGQRDEIAAYANIDPSTVTEKTRLLKGLGLLKSDKDGYHFTAKGVRFFRKWFGENSNPLDPLHPTTFEGHRQSPTAGNMMFEKATGTLEVSVTPESGGMSGIKGIKNESTEVPLTPETGMLSKMSNLKPVLDEGGVTPETGDMKDIRDTEKSEAQPVTSIQEVYETLRNSLKEAFYQQKALDLIIQQRKCDLKEAEKIFQTFVDEGRLFKDNDGLWMWSK